MHPFSGEGGQDAPFPASTSHPIGFPRLLSYRVPTHISYGDMVMGEFDLCPLGARDRTTLPSSYPSKVNAPRLLSLA